jgi:hypothetical protein
MQPDGKTVIATFDQALRPGVLDADNWEGHDLSYVLRVTAAEAIGHSVYLGTETTIRTQWYPYIAYHGEPPDLYGLNGLPAPDFLKALEFS